MAAVAAVERIKDKKSVEILIRALDKGDVQLSARCRKALALLTAVRPGDSNADWRRWWRENKDMRLAEWRERWSRIDELDEEKMEDKLKEMEERLEELEKQLEIELEKKSKPKNI